MVALSVRIACRLGAVWLCAAAHTASAWDWQRPAPLTPIYPLQPFGLAADATGYWMSGFALARYRVDGSLVAALPLGKPATLTADGQGGVYAAEAVTEEGGGIPEQPHCSLDHYLADGRLHWHSMIDSRFGCGVVARDGSGALWIGVGGGWDSPSNFAAAVRVYRLDARGIASRTYGGDSPGIRELAVQRSGSGAYVYETAQVVALNADASPSWRRDVDAAARGRLAVDAQNRPWLAEARAETNTVHLVHYAADGSTLRDVRVAVAPSPDAVLALDVAADGGLVALDRAQTSASLTLRRYGEDGTLRWSTPLDADVERCAEYFGRCLIAALPDGGVAVPLHLRGKSGFENSGLIALAVYDADGHRRGRISGAGDLVTGFAVLADGTSLLQMHVTGWQNFYPYFAEPPSLLGLDAQGQSAAVPSLARTVPAVSVPIAASLQADGETFLITQPMALPPSPPCCHGDDPIPGRYGLTHLGPDGTVLWHAQDDGLWADHGIVNVDDAVAVDGDRVCTAGIWAPDDLAATRLHLACFARSDGRRLWAASASGNATRGAVVAIALAPDRSVVGLMHDAAGRWQHFHYDADGALLRSRDVEDTMAADDLVRFDGQGNALLASPTRTVSLRPDGSERYRLSCLAHAEGLCLVPIDIAAGAAGDAIVLGSAPDNGCALALGPDGAVRWQTKLSGEIASGHLNDHGDAGVDLSLVPATGQIGTVVARLRRSDGAVQWRRPLPGSRHETLLPSHDTAQLALHYDIPQGLELHFLNGADGLDRGWRSVIDDAPYPGALRLGDDGSLRAVLVSSSGTPLLTSVAGLPGVASATSPARLDQRALGGAWWDPLTGGQGFMLDVLPDSRTFFLPWFTFATFVANDPSAQRWYTVQGSVPAGATQVELGIYTSRGGRFDAGTSTTTGRVGTATLNFPDCDHGTLQYRFDAPANEGKSGIISLSRLLPRTDACTLADGSTVPPEAVAPALDGFDARLGGSWFEPATAGQGLQLAVQPGGVVFAPWFTFDVAGGRDDPDAQHWFTLQGSLAAAHEGVADVAIVEAIGGIFDTTATYNQYVVGSATLRVLACDRLEVDYRFDDSDVAGAFRNKSGTLDLVKIGGCAP